MLELNQFHHSPFCLKVRMVLDAKALSYKIIEITPGIGQLAIFQKSGQKQVPVLVDGENILSDSSKIIRYLEQNYTEKSVIPKNSRDSALANIIENWADTTFARNTKKTLIKAAANDQDLRDSLLPENISKSMKSLINLLPVKEVINNVSEVTNDNESSDLMTSLEELVEIIQIHEYLIGDSLSIADIAVAAQLSLLRFPQSSGPKLAGKGCPGFSDNPQLISLFKWRDELEKKIMGRKVNN